MSTARSLAIRCRYGLQRVCSAREIARSTFYAQRQREAQPLALVAAIRRDLAETPFVGEGDRTLVEELRRALLEFKDTYNAHWRIERHVHRAPSSVRLDYAAERAA
jgi:hypothetical protein